jgi:DNA-binding PucR family transcriptional regulator
MPDCHVITHRKAVIAVCSLSDIREADHLLSIFPDEYEVRVGISSTFHRIELLREALSEAEDAVTVGSEIAPEKRSYSFEEYSIHIMLRRLAETEDITRYCHSAIPSLTEYDETYGTCLLPTIRTYLANGCSIKETAEALYLHRNSVIYRLHKIEELCGLKLDDPDTRFRLRLSFCILQVCI